MSGLDKKIAVVSVCDEKYHTLTLFSVCSIARSHSFPLRFFFMQSGYSQPVPLAIHEMLGTRGHTLTVMDAPVIDAASEAVGHRGNWAHVSAATFLRARAIDLIAIGFDYVLYVDGDTLAFEDLHCERVAGFSETAAACLDLPAVTGFEDPNFFANCENHGVSPEFINAGVMMINARKWLETRAGERFAENLRLHRDGCPYFSACAPNDQCALNMTFGSDLKLLPLAWNVQKAAFHTRAWQTAIIRHYTGARKFLPVRPWRCDPREYALLKEINRECRLSAPGAPYDFGVSFFLNKIRRRKEVARHEDFIAKMA